MISAAPATTDARREMLTEVDAGVVPAALGVEPCPLFRLGCPGVERRFRLVDVGATADRLDFEGFDDDALAVEDEAELLAVRRLEGRDHRRRRKQLAAGQGRHRVEDRDRDRGIGSLVAKVGTDEDPDVGVGDALPPHFVDGLCLQRRLVAGEVERVVDRLHHGAVSRRADVGEAHAIGGQHARIGVDQHGRDAEGVGDEAGMLAAGAAEAVEHVLGHVIAALDRNLLDGVGHVGDGDAQEAVGDLLRRTAVGDLFGKRAEAGTHGGIVERLVALLAEDVREVFRQQLADHEVGVGHRQRAALAIAGGPRPGPGGLRTDLVAALLVAEDRAAAGGDRVDPHHRRAHAHARDLGLEGALVFAVIVRHVGGGAAHVEADDLAEAGLPRRLDGGDHAAGRPGEDRVLALEEVGRGQAAGGLHEHETRTGEAPDRRAGRRVVLGRGAAQLVRHLHHVAPEERRQIGVDDGGVAAADELDQRARPRGSPRPAGSPCGAPAPRPAAHARAMPRRA